MPLKKPILTLLLPFAMLASAAVQASQTAQPDPRAIVKEDASPHDFAATVGKLKAQLVQDGWTLLAEIDLGSRIAKKGVHLPGGLVILELTSGGSTIPLLKDESTRHVAGLMPCSVSVYALDNGQVRVSRMNAGLMTGMMDPKIADALGKSMARLDASVAKALAPD